MTSADQSKRLLAMLSGCPDGATEFTLTTLHSFPQPVIDDLARKRLISVYDASVFANGRGKRIAINRVRITDAGKLALIAMNRNEL
jgi:hypothetical protein